MYFIRKVLRIILNNLGQASVNLLEAEHRQFEVTYYKQILHGKLPQNVIGMFYKSEMKASSEWDQREKSAHAYLIHRGY